MKTIEFDGTNEAEVSAHAVKVLAQGGLVIYPTETCYGVGVDASNQAAVDKLISYKGKRGDKPLSVAVTGEEMARRYAEVNATAHNLYENFLPGPLTVVSAGKHVLSRGVESPLGTLGIRVPDYPLIRSIVRQLDKPITASSANASYQKRPYKIADVLDNISDKQRALIDLIIDAGELPPRPPSTVVDTTLNSELVLRQGGLALTNTREFESNSPADTRGIGAKIIKPLMQHLGYKSVILALKGELGAGKTEMTKGVAQALEIADKIDSPTYVIENNYRIPAVSGSYLASKRVELVHIDVWRLENAGELEELDFRAQVENGNVFVIEWADKIVELLEKYQDEAIIVWVEIEYGRAVDSRLVKVSDFHS